MNKIYYYVHQESGSVWGSNNPNDHINGDGLVEPCTYKQAVLFMKEFGNTEIKHYKNKIMKKQELLNALAIVKPGLASQDKIEQTTSFAFIDGFVVTYNDEISISHPVKDLNVSGAVKAEELYNLLSKLKKEDVEITTNAGEESTELIITCGKVKASFIMYEEITLPLDEVFKKQSKWKQLPENFLPAMKMAMYSCSKSNSTPILTCVHVNVEGFVEGCDNYRMVHYMLEDKMPVKSFLIPARSVQELIKLNPDKIAEGKGWVHFKNANETVISCRIFEEEYTDTTPFLKINGETLNLPKSINEIIDRASVFAKRTNVLEEEVIITLNNNSAKVESKSNAGSFEEVANIKYTKAPLSFAIIPNMLKDILNETQQCTFNGKLLKFEGENWIYVTLLHFNKA
jgi:DNA polymerase III sliding clamp (beta) subunit (PCNA family)